MYMFIDVGGTHLRLAVSLGLEHLENQTVIYTPKDYESTISFIAKSISESSQVITHLIIGVAGVIENSTTRVLSAPHLEGWTNQNIRQDIQQIHPELIIDVINDAALVGLGEATVGAGSKEGIVSYLTVSTGVGGARIVNQEIDHYTQGFEPGHQVIDFHTKETLDGSVSGTGIEATYDKSYQELSPQEIEEVHQKLAIGIYNSILFWSPDVVVLGGGLVTHGLINLEKITKLVQEQMKIFPAIPKIVKATLEDRGGLLGAMAYARSKYVVDEH